MAYNNLMYFDPPLDYTWLGDNLPELRSIDMSYRELGCVLFNTSFRVNMSNNPQADRTDGRTDGRSD